MTNMGLCRYAGDQLLVLVTSSINQGPPRMLQKLQELITLCEQRGSRDASIPAGEDTSSFVQIVRTAQSTADVDNSVRSLLN